jgi:hypothetical protein
MSLAIEDGNFHTVKVGEHWRIQPVRSPYMCPLLECNGEKCDPARHMWMAVDPAHLVNGKPNDDCCYFDVEIMKVTDQVIECKTLPEPDGSYLVFEVLNSDAIVRFYRKDSV